MYTFSGLFSRKLLSQDRYIHQMGSFLTVNPQPLNFEFWAFKFPLTDKIVSSLYRLYYYSTISPYINAKFYLINC
jgi:hypothetical protein